MSINLRLPNITAHNAEGKLIQVQSYLYQLVEQLNVALTTVEGQASAAVIQAKAAASMGSSDDKAQVSFNSIKALIIKSADIIEAYYEEISARLEGDFVAISDFGTFQETTLQELEATSTGIKQLYSNIQTLTTEIENLEHSVIEVNAHINSGLLYYDEDGAPIYGLEVGQRTEIDGVEVFNKYAQFTAAKLAFFDQNGIEVAYISDKKLFITHAEVTGSFRMGGFVDTVKSDGGIVSKWVGIGG